MGSNKFPMDTVSRRTRNQWDNFYREKYNEKKRAQESSGRSNRKGSKADSLVVDKKDESSGVKIVSGLKRGVERTKEKVGKISEKGMQLNAQMDSNEVSYDVVSRRTRNKWNAFYREKDNEKKKEQERSGRSNQKGPEGDSIVVEKKDESVGVKTVSGLKRGVKRTREGVGVSERGVQLKGQMGSNKVPRTRNQWNVFYREKDNEKKDQESSGRSNQRQSKEDSSVVHKKDEGSGVKVVGGLKRGVKKTRGGNVEISEKTMNLDSENVDQELNEKEFSARAKSNEVNCGKSVDFENDKSNHGVAIGEEVSSNGSKMGTSVSGYVLKLSCLTCKNCGHVVANDVESSSFIAGKINEGSNNGGQKVKSGLECRNLSNGSLSNFENNVISLDSEDSDILVHLKKSENSADPGKPAPGPEDPDISSHLKKLKISAHPGDSAPDLEDSENLIDLRSESVDSEESEESSSEEDNDRDSDEDYRGDESSTSNGSDVLVSCSDSDVDGQEKDINIHLDDNAGNKVHNDCNEEKKVVLSDEVKCGHVRKSKRISGKLESEKAGTNRKYEAISSGDRIDDESIGGDNFEMGKAEKAGQREVDEVLESGLNKRKMADPSGSSTDDDQNIREKAVMLTKKKTRGARELDTIKILIDSIWDQVTPPEGHHALTPNTLPLKFRFEDEVPHESEKTELEKETETLFRDLEMGLREFEIGCNDSSVADNVHEISADDDAYPVSCCARGEHHFVLDEQIGIKCKYCGHVHEDIRYVCPPFYTPPSRQWDKLDSSNSPSSIVAHFHFQDSASGNFDSPITAKGTVFDLIPGISSMFPHQREGFEFMWRSIAGDIFLENLRKPLSDGGRGCIISHAPGTGKTRLSIVFLQTFMRLYPTCRPVIIAPRGMLLTWEDEFLKWNVGLPFHNMNKPELTGEENEIAINAISPLGSGKNLDYIRLVKLYSWMKGQSILGISYKLFERLAGNHTKKGPREQMRKMLLELPGLLVLDEGHTPRNSRSLMWKALTKVVTQRRIILSGTLFQNNFSELYNTLSLVNPKFCKKKFTDKDFSKSSRALEELRTKIDPFVHVHKGNILEESLPGLRETLIFLKSTNLQKDLSQKVPETLTFFSKVRLVALISVHPSLAAVEREVPHLNRVASLSFDPNDGVKTKFVLKLIELCDALQERVLIFSQYIDPLLFIGKQLNSRFSWKKGKEILYMDGKIDQRKRQSSISAFNDFSSEAKVLLASERACSEGISLIGASRVVLLDVVWNPSVERQALSRAYRLGQKKVVHVYHLITYMEVEKYARQAEKSRLSKLLFCPADEPSSRLEPLPTTLEDKVLESLMHNKSFSSMFDKIREIQESDVNKALDFSYL